MARLWVVVLMANLAGAVLFSWVVANTPMFDPDILHAFNQIGWEAIGHPFGA